MGAANAQSLTGSSPGFHHFYKAGAGMGAHDGDLVDCAVAIRGLVNGSDAMTGIAAATGGGLIPALVGGIIDSKENRQGAAANIENCMAMKGWSVIGLTEEEAEIILEQDDPASIHTALEPFVVAPEPRGTMLRGPFANELATGDFVIGEARKRGEDSLSVSALRDLMDEAIDAAGKFKPPKVPKLDDGVKAPKPIKSMKDDDLIDADPDASYVVIRLQGSNRLQLNGTGLFLHRLNNDGTEVVYDGLPLTAPIGGRRVAKTKVGDQRLYDIIVKLPPGQWKIASLSYLQFVTDLCFGAPAFTIGEGEVLFLGDITVGESGGYPLQRGDLEVAKSILAPAPALASKVQAAEYTNGFVSDCFGSYAYAYEVEGAAVRDDHGGEDLPAVSASIETQTRQGTHLQEGGANGAGPLEGRVEIVSNQAGSEAEYRTYKPGAPAPNDKVANDLNVQQLDLISTPMKK